MTEVKDIEWRPVLGFETLYEVSNTGLVRSLPRNTTSGKILGQRLINVGYYVVRFSENGRPINKFVHTLVAEAFIGPRPEGLVIDHIDGNPKNNHVSNLEYVTQKENMRRARELGLWDPTVNSIGQTKLNPEAVVVIRMVGRYCLKEVGGQYNLAKAFGVTQPHISDVMNKHAWKNVNEDDYENAYTQYKAALSDEDLEVYAAVEQATYEAMASDSESGHREKDRGQHQAL